MLIGPAFTTTTLVPQNIKTLLSQQFNDYLRPSEKRMARNCSQLPPGQRALPPRLPPRLPPWKLYSGQQTDREACKAATSSTFNADV